MMRACMLKLFQNLYKSKCQTQAGVERQEHQTEMQTDVHARAILNRLSPMI